MSYDLLVTCLLVTMCVTHNVTNHEYEVLVGRNLSTPSSCDIYYLVEINTILNLTTRGHVVDPPCSIGLLGGEFINETYKDVCFRVKHIHIPCGNSYIEVEVWPVAINATGVYRNATMPYMTYKSTCRQNMITEGLSICPDGFEFHLLVRMFTNITGSLRKDMHEESIQLVVEKPPPEYSQDVIYHFQARQIKLDCTEETCGDGININIIGNKENEDKDDKSNDDTSFKPVDINNIITILGGVVSSLCIPVALYYIRQRIRSTHDIHRTSRNPGDGTDEVDGNAKTIEDSDDKETKESKAYLLTPRNSIYSDDISFHSTFSSI